jgi:pantothenate kinase
LGTWLDPGPAGGPVVATSLAQLVGRARALCEKGDRALLGIVGPAGSGKSTLTAQVAAALPASSSVVGMDGFHLANSELARLGRSNRKGAIDTFDSHGYVALLERLLRERGHIVYAPFFDRSVDEAIAGASPVLPEVEVVITEGLYLLDNAEPWSAVRSLLSEVWYCQLDDGERVARLVRRHVQFGKSEGEATDWVYRSDEVNTLRVTSARARCDVIVDIAQALGTA